MFQKIVIVEPVSLAKAGKEELKKYCKELVAFDEVSTGEEETIRRIGNADCILISTFTVISKQIIEKANYLKHVVLCGSYYGKQFAKIDIDALEQNHITYSHLAEHGDNGVVEFTVAQVINLLHGLAGKQWKTERLDLSHIKIGILGLGNLGGKIAKTFKIFGSEIYYYSKTRKEILEKTEGYRYLELKELLKTVDILSINVNRDVCLIGKENLKIFGNHKIIVNTSIGKCYETETLKEWLTNKDNYYICDQPTMTDEIKDIIYYENVIYYDDSVGDTKQCLERATAQIINHVKKYSKLSDIDETFGKSKMLECRNKNAKT